VTQKYVYEFRILIFVFARLQHLFPSSGSQSYRIHLATPTFWVWPWYANVQCAQGMRLKTRTTRTSTTGVVISDIVCTMSHDSLKA